MARRWSIGLYGFQCFTLDAALKGRNERKKESRKVEKKEVGTKSRKKTSNEWWVSGREGGSEGGKERKIKRERERRGGEGKSMVIGMCDIGMHMNSFYKLSRFYICGKLFGVKYFYICRNPSKLISISCSTFQNMKFAIVVGAVPYWRRHTMEMAFGGDARLMQSMPCNEHCLYIISPQPKGLGGL